MSFKSDESGAFTIVSALTALIVILFLAAIMPSLLAANGTLATSLAGHPVELVVVGLIPLILLIVALQSILASGQRDIGY